MLYISYTIIIRKMHCPYNVKRVSQNSRKIRIWQLKQLNQTWHTMSEVCDKLVSNLLPVTQYFVWFEQYFTVEMAPNSNLAWILGHSWYVRTRNKIIIDCCRFILYESSTSGDVNEISFFFIKGECIQEEKYVAGLSKNRWTRATPNKFVAIKVYYLNAWTVQQPLKTMCHQSWLLV